MNLAISAAIVVIIAARLAIDYLTDKHTGAHLARPWEN